MAQNERLCGKLLAAQLGSLAASSDMESTAAWGFSESTWHSHCSAERWRRKTMENTGCIVTSCDSSPLRGLDLWFNDRVALIPEESKLSRVGAAAGTLPHWRLLTAGIREGRV